MRQLPEAVCERGDARELLREAAENVPAPPHGTALRNAQVGRRGPLFLRPKNYGRPTVISVAALSCVVGSLNPDPENDPDPLFQVNPYPDPDTDPEFSRPKIGKKC